jgi:acyl-coenzyme A synthetase/AMP-(fatty) acid ligase
MTKDLALMVYRWDHDAIMRGPSRWATRIPRPRCSCSIRAIARCRRARPAGSSCCTRFASPGYWGRPDLTAERFRRDGDHTVFYTGDLGSQDDDGCFHHLGRKDNQVKIRGNRVELGEVEAVLVRLPGVRDALAVRHEEEGRELLVAYYIPDGAERPTASALRAALRELLPDYMVPAAYVPTDAFPVNANGKLDRHRLPPPSRREHRI